MGLKPEMMRGPEFDITYNLPAENESTWKIGTLMPRKTGTMDFERKLVMQPVVVVVAAQRSLSLL